MSQPEPNLIDQLAVLRQNLFDQFNALQTQLRNLGQAIAVVDQQIQRVLMDRQAKLTKLKETEGKVAASEPPQ